MMVFGKMIKNMVLESKHRSMEHINPMMENGKIIYKMVMVIEYVLTMNIM